MFDAATGLELSKTYADGSSVQKTYDAYNRLATETDARGNVKSHSYEHARGLQLGTSYSDNSIPRSFSYNHLGQMVQLVDDAGTRTFGYDAYGERVSDSLVVDGDTHLITEQRDAFGRSTGYVYSKNGATQQTVATGYGTDGRINSTSFLHGGAAKVFGYEYLPGSHLLYKLTKPNGMSMHNTYEHTRDLLMGIEYYRGSTLVAQRDYVYDAIGRPTERNTARQGRIVTDTFAHNSRSELEIATVNGANYEYVYDNIGNREFALENNKASMYEANALNQYTAISENGAAPFVPQFDADGNQTLIKTDTGIWSAVYNAENRPVSFTNADSGTVVECVYDSMGRRAYKKVSVNGSITLHQRYIYRDYLQIACIDLTRSHHPALWYITWDVTQSVATRPLAIQINGTWYTYGWELTKNICELYSTGGTLTTAYTYSPFGKVTASGSLSQPIQWSSEFNDTELGLVYYNWRYYNTMNGRWHAHDRLHEIANLTLYSYCNNNPILLFDFIGNWFSQINNALKNELRSHLYEATLQIGEFDRTKKIPLEFLRKYIYEDSSPYILNKNDIIHTMKPYGTLSSSRKFEEDIKKNCNSTKLVNFSGTYIVNFVDTGHKTGGLGRFNMKIITDIDCCLNDKTQTYDWFANGKAYFEEEKWDFDSSLDKVIKEFETKLQNKKKYGSRIEILKGREIRTYLFSFAPGKPFNIRCEDEILVYQSSYIKNMLFLNNEQA